MTGDSSAERHQPPDTGETRAPAAGSAPGVAAAEPGSAAAPGRAAEAAAAATAAASTELAAAAEADEAIRLGRRRFFRAFVSDAVRTAANVVGVAGALQRTSAEVAGAILTGADPEAPASVPARGPGHQAPFVTGTGAAGGAAGGTGGTGPGVGAAAGTSGATADGGVTDLATPGVPAYRSPFRVEADTVVLLDQRRLPGELVDVICRTAPDIRVAVLEGVIHGASAISQVAALALALAAGGAATSKPYARRAVISGSANSLRAAAGSAAPVRRALDRMLAVMNRRPDLFADGPGLAAAMRAEADAIVGEATMDHALLGGHGATLFAAVPDREPAPLRILTLGSVGALAAGQVGSVLAVVNRLVADGRPVEMVLCETRPALTGTRLTGWELAAAGVPYELIPDAGAGALIAAGDVDIVLVGADAIAANGDVQATAGTCALALLAARAGIPFAVVAPGVTVDPAAPDGAALRSDPRPAHQVLTVAGGRIAPAGATARNPGVDVTPHELVGAIVTEQGVLWPPYPDGLATVAAAVGRRGILALPLPADPAGEPEETPAALEGA